MNKEEKQAKAHARIMYVYELRKQGLTFAKIGEKFNVCGQRARQLFKIAERINKHRYGY